MSHHQIGVLSNRATEALDTPIVPVQRAPFALTRPETAPIYAVDRGSRRSRLRATSKPGTNSGSGFSTTPGGLTSVIRAGASPTAASSRVLSGTKLSCFWASADATARVRHRPSTILVHAPTSCRSGPSPQAGRCINQPVAQSPIKGSDTRRSRVAWEHESQILGSSRSSRRLCNRLKHTGPPRCPKEMPSSPRLRRVASPRQPRCPGIGLEHGELVAQEEDLGVLGAIRSGEQGQASRRRGAPSCRRVAVARVLTVPDREILAQLIR